MDYGVPEQRKSKKSSRKKRRLRVYKKGGQFRCIKLDSKPE
ncbi:MAG: hypothetical protein V1886_03625 [archaeon]